MNLFFEFRTLNAMVGIKTRRNSALAFNVKSSPRSSISQDELKSKDGATVTVSEYVEQCALYRAAENHRLSDVNDFSSHRRPGRNWSYINTRGFQTYEGILAFCSPRFVFRNI